MGLFKDQIHLDFTKILWTKCNSKTDYTRYVRTN